MSALATFGDWDEILIAVDHIVSIEAVAALDRAGRPMLPPSTPSPVFVGSAIGLDTGTSIEVPHEPVEVVRRIEAAQLASLR